MADSTVIEQNEEEIRLDLDGDTQGANDEYLKNYESLFGMSDDERLRLQALGSKLDIKENDALWLIIYSMNYFGRFYSDIPERLQKSADNALESVKARCAYLCDDEIRKMQTTLSEMVVESARELAQKRGLADLVLPLAWISCSLFVVCALCFAGGAALAGKGWGRSPLDAFFNIPAGWIIPIAALPLAGFTVYRSYQSFSATKKKKALMPMIGASMLLSLAVFSFLRIFFIG